MSLGGDINFDVKVMAGYRRFCNKMYQATKYVLGKLPSDFKPRESAAPTGDESLAERWILHKLSEATKGVNDALTDRDFSRSTQIIYNYWYDCLCDVYIVSDCEATLTTTKLMLNNVCTIGELKIDHPGRHQG